MEKCSILRWRGNNCTDARIWRSTSIPHVPATPNAKPHNSVLLDLFCIHKSSFLEYLYKAWPLHYIPNPLIFLLLPSSFFKCWAKKIHREDKLLMSLQPFPKILLFLHLMLHLLPTVVSTWTWWNNLNRERTFKETPHKPLWIVTKKASDCFGWLMMSGDYWWSTIDFWTGKKWTSTCKQPLKLDPLQSQIYKFQDQLLWSGRQKQMNKKHHSFENRIQTILASSATITKACRTLNEAQSKLDIEKLFCLGQNNLHKDIWRREWCFAGTYQSRCARNNN